jgi:hypothetical protein
MPEAVITSDSARVRRLGKPAGTKYRAANPYPAAAILLAVAAVSGVEQSIPLDILHPCPVQRFYAAQEAAWPHRIFLVQSSGIRRYLRKAERPPAFSDTLVPFIWLPVARCISDTEKNSPTMR